VGLFCHASQKTINEHLKFSVFSFFPVNTVIEFFYWLFSLTCAPPGKNTEKSTKAVTGAVLFQCEGGSSVSLPESLLFVSTLDGSLHAISKQTGDIKWTLKEGVCLCVYLHVCALQQVITERIWSDHFTFSLLDPIIQVPAFFQE